ncbi:MAG: DNA-directed RNA polymerase subunit omega [Lachnospiraceae bacterium]
MLHPSYSDLMEVVNSDVVEGEQPVVQSRYSIVLATAKRARQIVSGEDSLVKGKGKKPLSVAVEELYKGKIKILSEEEAEALEAEEALRKAMKEAEKEKASMEAANEADKADEEDAAEETEKAVKEEDSSEEKTEE